MLQNGRDKAAGWLGPVWRSWKADALLRRLLNNASIVLGGKAVNALFSVGYLALAARGLSLEAFGTLILIHTYTQAVGDFTKFQSWQAVLAYGTPAWNEGRLRHLRQVLRFTVRLDVLGAVAALGIALLGIPAASALFGWQPETARYASFYVISVLLLDAATTTGVLRLFDRFDLAALQSALGALVRLLGAGAAFYYGAGLEVYLAVWFAANIVPGLASIGMTLRVLRHKGVLGPQPAPAAGGETDWKPDRRVWGFAWSTNLNTTLQLALSHFGTLAVGALLGAPAAALYRVARQISEAITTPVKTLTPTIYPELARLSSQGALPEMRRLMRRAALLAGAGASLLAVLLALAGPWILFVVGGEKYTAAYGVMTLLGVAAAIRLWAFPLEPMLISSGNATAALRIRIVSTIVYTAMLFLLCPPLGLTGAGVALLLTSLVNLAGQLITVEKWLRRRALTA